uniref:Uncharacterized protein n=1 Tax=Plectus sambesii TaxID=2011161 RepID=A0A914XC94_9BILA
MLDFIVSSFRTPSYFCLSSLCLHPHRVERSTTFRSRSVGRWPRPDSSQTCTLAEDDEGRQMIATTAACPLPSPSLFRDLTLLTVTIRERPPVVSVSPAARIHPSPATAAHPCRVATGGTGRPIVRGQEGRPSCLPGADCHLGPAGRPRRPPLLLARPREHVPPPPPSVPLGHLLYCAVPGT